MNSDGSGLLHSSSLVADIENEPGALREGDSPGERSAALFTKVGNGVSVGVGARGDSQEVRASSSGPTEEGR